MTIGKLIREHRVALKLTQKELAEKCYTTESTVSKWESDKIQPNIDTIKIIANILNVDPSLFLGSNNEPLKKSTEEVFFEIKANCNKWEFLKSKISTTKKIAILLPIALVTLIGLILLLAGPFIKSTGTGIGEEAIKLIIPGQ